jgi:hypothetical protein
MKCQDVQSWRLILHINPARIVNGSVFRSAYGIPCRADCLIVQGHGLIVDALIQGGSFPNKERHSRLPPLPRRYVLYRSITVVASSSVDHTGTLLLPSRTS